MPIFQRPNKKPILWGIVFICLLCGNGLAEEIASDFNTNFGPGMLVFSSASFGQSLRSSLIPLVPEKIDPGRFKIRLSSSWVNYFGKIGRARRVYILDCEMLQNQLSVSYGIDRRFSAGVSITHREFFGGAMDSFIQGFHELFSLDNNGRELRGKDVFEVMLCDLEYNIVAHIGEPETIENSRIDFFASHIISPGTAIFPAVNLFSTLGVGIGTPFARESNPADLILGIGASKRWTPNLYSLHCLSYTFFDTTESEDFFKTNNAFNFFNSIAWQLDPVFSLVFHHAYSEGIYKNLQALNESSHELYAGVIWKTANRGTLEIALSENIMNYGSSPDFGVHCAYTFEL